ncbi:hypothetical protein AB0J21_17470 [Streptomyces sp. NPDC049954]|uniref:hypothetical protein n=1 Tax=Streptomyces sp. NPDC049954 TaxID=3155779 RepID=UPI00342C58A2
MKSWTVAVVIMAAMFSGASQARAERERSSVGTTQSATSGPHTITSRVTLTASPHPHALSSRTPTGPLTPTTPHWSPPPCWYEPFWTAEAFRTFTEAKWAMHTATGGAPGDFAADRRRYGDFHTRDERPGMWWVAVDNPEIPGDARAGQCARKPFWVPRGTVPSVPRAMTPAMLAALAYQSTRVPGTEVGMTPADRSVVNLPSWIWLDRSRFTPVSVTARLPQAGLWARTTARPVGLRVDPGAARAVTYPASGECPTGPDGTIGAPRRGGADAADLPPCGVTYLRSSGGRTYALRATLNWRVDWAGSGGTGGELPGGTYGQTRDVTVQEIQSVVRQPVAGAR